MLTSTPNDTSNKVATRPTTHHSPLGVLFAGCLLVCTVLLGAAFVNDTFSMRGKASHEVLHTHVEIPGMFVGMWKWGIESGMNECHANKAIHGEYTFNEFAGVEVTSKKLSANFVVAGASQLVHQFGDVPELMPHISGVFALSVATRVFFCLSVVLFGVAFILQAVFRREPRIRLFGYQGVSKAHRINIGSVSFDPSTLPITVSFFGVCSLVLAWTLFASYAHNVVHLIVLYAIESCLPSLTMDQLFSLEFHVNVGEIVLNENDSSFGPSSYLALAAFFLEYLAVVLVIYRGVSKVEALIPKEELMRKIEALPSYCQVAPIPYLIVLTTAAFVSGTMGNWYARRTGADINIKALEMHLREIKEAVEAAAHTGRAVSWKLLGTFVVDPFSSEVVGSYWLGFKETWNFVVFTWLPAVFVVALGSNAHWIFAGKVVEILCMCFIMRLFCIICTTYPTSLSVYEAPMCYQKPEFSFKELFGGEYCNDMLFSGHTLLVSVPAAILFYWNNYGPNTHKTSAKIALLVTCGYTEFLIIACRLHYTADVLVSLFVAKFMVFVNYPLWHVLFTIENPPRKSVAPTEIYQLDANDDERDSEPPSDGDTHESDFNTIGTNVSYQKASSLPSLSPEHVQEGTPLLTTPQLDNGGQTTDNTWLYRNSIFSSIRRGLYTIPESP